MVIYTLNFNKIVLWLHLNLFFFDKNDLLCVKCHCMKDGSISTVPLFKPVKVTYLLMVRGKIRLLCTKKTVDRFIYQRFAEVCTMEF